MPRRFFLSLIYGVMLLSFALTTAANAQLAIEKTLVAKSKLHSEIWTKHDPASTLKVDHSAWSRFLSTYVFADETGVNRVAYSRVSPDDRQNLLGYIQTLQQTDVTKLNRNEQFAFWVNLYNANVVRIAIENASAKSILDVKSNPLDLKGPFNDKIAQVKGKNLTLDDIESGIVRPIWNDPRLHYVFNCGAVGCPNLGKEAYRGDKINAQLNAAAKAYVNDPRGVKVENGEITVSKIFFWYDVDFGGTEQAVLEHIAQYAAPDLAAQLKGKTAIDAYEYDWALNKTNRQLGS